jgi:DNA modification methylase
VTDAVQEVLSGTRRWAVEVADARAFLSALPDGCVGHVVTDPPYGQTNEAYDSPVAFSPDVWRECYRVTWPNAALVSFAGSPTYHRIASAIEAAGWKVRQMWGWVYRNGFITSAYPTEGFDRLAPAFDPIVFATKGKVLLNLEREAGPTWERQRNIGERPDFSDRTSSHGAATANGRWPRSLVADADLNGFRYFVLNPNSPSLRDEKVDHPNQKPDALMLWIVSKLPPAEIILDPFTGSGSTAVAAQRCGFRFLGCDREEKYVETARRRILNAIGTEKDATLPPTPKDALPLFETLDT